MLLDLKSLWSCLKICTCTRDWALSLVWLVLYSNLFMNVTDIKFTNLIKFIRAFLKLCNWYSYRYCDHAGSIINCVLQQKKLHVFGCHAKVVTGGVRLWTYFKNKCYFCIWCVWCKCHNFSRVESFIASAIADAAVFHLLVLFCWQHIHLKFDHK